MNFVFPFEENFYIYKITNILNSKIYIGRTNLPKYRKRQHVSLSIDPKKSIASHKLHFAMNELGHENFTFEVFEKTSNYQKSCERESFWIDHYKSNIDEFGYNEKMGPIESVILTDDDRKKLSLRVSGENNPMYGKKHTQDTLSKMSELFYGKNNPFYGKTHSDEVKSIIGLKSKGRNSGENNSHAKLTVEIVSQIREDWKTGIFTKAALGKKYNISGASIGHIISGKTWK